MISVIVLVVIDTINRSTNIDVSTPPPPRFMIQTKLSLFIVERIFKFYSTSVAIISSNSYFFVYPSRSKMPYTETLKFLANIFIKQDKKVDLIRVD